MGRREKRKCKFDEQQHLRVPCLGECQMTMFDGEIWVYD